MNDKVKMTPKELSDIVENCIILNDIIAFLEENYKKVEDKISYTELVLNSEMIESFINDEVGNLTQTFVNDIIMLLGNYFEKYRNLIAQL